MCSYIAMSPNQTKNIIKLIRSAKGFEEKFQKIKIIYAGQGSCLAQLEVCEEFTARTTKMLHAGFVASLVDVVCKWALKTHTAANVSSIPVDANIRYFNFRNTTVGHTLLIDAETLRVEGECVNLICKVENKADGEVLVKATITRLLQRNTNVGK